MRRAFGVILVVLGALFIGIGLLAKPYLYAQLAIVPLDQRSTSVSEGASMAVLYPHVVNGAPVIDKLTNTRVINTQEVLGIPGVVKKAGVEDTDAFWQSTTKAQAELNGALVDLSYSDEGVSLNRVSAESTNCCGDYQSIGDLTDPTAQEDVTHAGLTFKFPFDVEKTTYKWWDSSVGRAVPIQFTGEDTINGLPVYVFKQTIPSEKVSSIEAPADLFQVGATGNVTANEMYANTRTLWVEPVTGVVIDGREEIKNVYEADGYGPVAKTVGTIGFNDKTVKSNTDEWAPKAKLLSFIQNWLTIVGIVLGGLLAGLGAFLLLRRTEPEPTAAPDSDPDSNLDDVLPTRTSRTS